jgi:DNA-directed RNA polymerase subunit RPC12/RpoP
MDAAPQTPESLRCPACGAPVDVGKLRPWQLTVVCDYCGTAVFVARRPSLPPSIRLASRGKWVQGGWAGDPRVWVLFVVLLLGLVTLLVFGDFGPR